MTAFVRTVRVRNLIEAELEVVQPELVGSRVRLRPMGIDDASLLLPAAEDGRLWESRLTVLPGPDTADAYVATALAGRNPGMVTPFVILDKASGEPIGSTRFRKIDRRNRKLGIGHTWLSASRQRTGANTETKYLVLTHAFEAMRCVRVQFTTDELNERSRAVILRIGAKQEGIIRYERIMPDGRRRNSVRFSIINDE